TLRSGALSLPSSRK
ncbi:helix-turn-helix family protein, partial [Vibrio sp. HENC-03]